MVKWKKNNALNPEIILDKINSLRLISDNGEISFSGGIEIELAQSALETMIDFPSETMEKNNLILQAICAPEPLAKDNVIKKINELIAQRNSKKETVFHILSSISLLCKESHTIDIEESKIDLLSDAFPATHFLARNKLLENTVFSDNDIHKGYSKIIVQVKAKSVTMAIEKGLKFLDLQRAIWCLISNPTMELFGDEFNPINRIRLGEVHTIHNEDGTAALDGFWSEPNFVKTKQYEFKPELKENSEYFLKQLKKSKYSSNLKDALLRYVRALDEKDHNNALIKLWGALESLTVPSGANADLVTRRCSFLFADHKFHKQSLEHLRERRNRTVHAGYKSEEAKKLCFQLQYYFLRLMRFHIIDAGRFPTLEKANEFLDLPPDKDELLRRKDLIDLALSFVN